MIHDLLFVKDSFKSMKMRSIITTYNNGRKLLQPGKKTLKRKEKQ